MGSSSKQSTKQESRQSGDVSGIVDSNAISAGGDVIIEQQLPQAVVDLFGRVFDFADASISSGEKQAQDSLAALKGAYSEAQAPDTDFLKQAMLIGGGVIALVTVAVIFTRK